MGSFISGKPHLRFDAAVLELYHAMDNTLRMNNYLYLVGLQTEKPFGLYHLKPFVHKRGGIDGDLGAHVPVGMLQGMISFDIDKEIGLFTQEGAAGSGEDDLLDTVPRLTDQTLKDSRMLRVDRENGRLVLERFLHDDIAGNDQGLLISQRDRLAVRDGAQSRTQTRKTDDGGQHHVIVVQRSHLFQGFLAGIDLDRMS